MLLRTAVTSDSNIATSSLLFSFPLHLDPKRGATAVLWKWISYKRSEVQANTTNLFHLFKQEHPVENEEILTVIVSSKPKNILSILSRIFLNHRNTLKHCPPLYHNYFFASFI